MAENPKNQLFTELFRPKSLDQAVIVPRIREELEKGLVANTLLYGKPGSGKCLGYDEKIDIYVDEDIYNQFFKKS